MLGVHVDRLVRGECVLRIPWNDRLIGDPTRPAVHGGVISMLADTSGGAVCFSMLDNRDDRVSTVDLRVDYLRPGPSQDLLCRAKVIRMGNKVAVTRMEVFAHALPAAGEEGEPIATAQAVYNVVRRSE
nr:hotdog fold thioesterase [Pseudenhygromyxa sp. WMMC2535]